MWKHRTDKIKALSQKKVIYSDRIEELLKSSITLSAEEEKKVMHIWYFSRSKIIEKKRHNACNRSGCFSKNNRN